MTTADISIGDLNAARKQGFSSGYFCALGTLATLEGGSANVEEILYAHDVRKGQTVAELKADLLAKGASEYDAEAISLEIVIKRLQGGKSDV